MKKLSFAFAFIFLGSGCKTDSQESRRYEILQNIDNGNFNDALSDLNDCSGFTNDECHLNRGMAYFGLAGYDIIQIGEDLYRAYSNNNISLDEKNLAVTSIILDRFNNNYIDRGLVEYKTVLNNNGKSETSCNKTEFYNLSRDERQACLSINPVLLLEIIDNNSNQNNISVDLEDIYNLNHDLKSLITGITSNDIASILSGYGELSNNTNGELDSISCLYNLGCYGLEKKSVGKYENLDIWLLSRDDFSTIKLTDQTGSIVLVDEVEFISQTGETCYINDYEKFDGNCFHKPLTSSTNNINEFTTIKSTLINELNDESVRNSVSLLFSIGETDKTETEQVNSYFSEICGSSNCVVTEKNLIEYFNK